MTVSTTIGYQRTSGDGVVTVFGVDFALIEAAQLIVELVNKSTGEVSTQILGTHFTLAIAADNQSATVTMLTAPPATHWVVRRRNALYTQPTHLLPHGPFPADLVELAIDRMMMTLQAIRDGFLRGIRFSDTDPPTTVTLPPLAQMLGRYIYIDDDGNPVGVAGQASVPVSPAWADVIISASLADGLTELGFSSYMQSIRGTASKAALQAELGVNIGGDWRIWGLKWTKNGANTIDVSAGGARADDGETWMAYAGGTALDLAALFSSGSSGLRDSGSIADTDYWLWMVFNPTTGVTRPLASTSRTAPDLPSGFTKKRLFGWIRRSAGALVAVNVYETAGGGVEVAWATRTTDVTETIGAARTLVALARVPVGLKVQANLSLESNVNVAALDVFCPDQADVAPAFGAGGGVAGTAMGVTLSGGDQTVTGISVPTKVQLRVRTNTAGEVAMYASSAGVSVYATVISFEWPRRPE